MNYRTVKINCQCGTLLMKYKKFGKGRVLKCYLPRILKNKFKVENNYVICPDCGSVIGHLLSGLKGDYIKLDQKKIKPVQV